MHPDEAILRSFDCPGVTLLLRGEVFSKIPVELVNYPLTGHHPSLGENFYMFHPLTLQLLGRIVPEQRNAKDCLQHHYILVCIGQVNNQRDGGTCGYKVGNSPVFLLLLSDLKWVQVVHMAACDLCFTWDRRAAFRGTLKAKNLVPSTTLPTLE